MILWKTVLAGCAAGAVNGLFGAGGGMVLIPLLTALHITEDRELFPTSVSIMLPLSAVSLWVGSYHWGIPIREALPYLAGGVIGGIAAGRWGRKIPTHWLHWGLGIMLVWGGIRYLW